MKKTLLTLAAVYTAFIAGFLIHYFYIKYLPKQQEVPSECNITKNYCATTNDLHLEDFDIVVATEQSPHKIFHINKIINRVEDYKQAQVIYSIDGTNLKTTMAQFDSVVVTKNNDNKSNIEYSVQAEFTAGKNRIKVIIPTLTLGMVIRALPMEAKYAGATPTALATIDIDGMSYPAYAAMTMGYFTKYLPVDIDKQQVTTKWAMYWDSSWKFYHLDYSNVPNPTEEYYSHQFLATISPSQSLVEYMHQVKASEFKDGGFEVNYMAYKPVTLHLKSLSSLRPYRKTDVHLVTSDEGGLGMFLDLDYRRVN